jgi:hypothetical protein
VNVTKGRTRMSGTADTLNQADALLAPVEIPPWQYVAAELFIHDRETGLDEQRLITQALGLDANPEPKTYHAAHRRAVPDLFRRGGRPT